MPISHSPRVSAAGPQAHSSGRAGTQDDNPEARRQLRREIRVGNHAPADVQISRNTYVSRRPNRQAAESSNRRPAGPTESAARLSSWRLARDYRVVMKPGQTQGAPRDPMPSPTNFNSGSRPMVTLRRRFARPAGDGSAGNGAALSDAAAEPPNPRARDGHQRGGREARCGMNAGMAMSSAPRGRRACWLRAIDAPRFALFRSATNGRSGRGKSLRLPGAVQIDWCVAT